MIYCISSIRCHSFSLPIFHVATIEGGYYSRVAFVYLESTQALMDSWIRYIWAIQWWLLDAVSILHSLLVLLKLVIQQTVAGLWFVFKNYSHTHVYATYTSHGYYSRAVFIFLRPFLVVRLLFESGNYLRAASNRRNMVLIDYCMNVQSTLLSILEDISTSDYYRFSLSWQKWVLVSRMVQSREKPIP